MNGYVKFANKFIIQWGNDNANNDINLGTDYDTMTATFFPISFTDGQPIIIPIIRNGYDGTDVTPCNIAINNPSSNPSNYWILWRKQFYFRQKSSSVIGVRSFKYIAIGY